MAPRLPAVPSPGLPRSFRAGKSAGKGAGRTCDQPRITTHLPTLEITMHHHLSAELASARERELRSLVHRPERQMARELELARGRTPGHKDAQ